MKQKLQIVPSKDRRQFDFTVDSMVDGELVSVYKRVLFDDPDEEGRTNMVLADVLDDGSLSDSTRSGNGQVDAIFNAVSNCVVFFLNAYPAETVSFQGSDPEGITTRDKEGMSLRQILYNRFLSKKDNYQMSGNHVVVYGGHAKKSNDAGYEEYIELYKPNSRAKMFIIQLKK